MFNDYFKSMNPGIIRFAVTSLLASILINSDVLAIERYVDKNGCGASQPCYPTIKDAVAASAPGDIITVAPGVYDGNIIIEKPLSVRGANYGSSGAARIAESRIQELTSGLPLFTILSDGVTIDGFELTAPLSNNAITNGSAGHSNLTIVNNYIHDIGTGSKSGNVYAIHYMVGNGITSNISIAYNIIEKIYNSTIAAVGHSGGIWFGQSTSAGTVNNLTIERNRISDVFSKATDKYSWGIVIGTGSKSTGSVISPLIRYNTILNIQGKIACGIELDGNTSGAVVSNNLISNIHTFDGAISASSAECGIALVTNRGSSTISVNNNSITDVKYSIVNATKVAVNGTCNWTGSPLASDVASSFYGSVSVGGKIYNTVLYDPWLVDGTNISDGPGFIPLSGKCSVISLSESHKNVTCYDARNGSADLTAEGGTAPYSFTWTTTNGYIPVDQIDVEDPQGLAPGTYKVFVLDVNGLSATLTLTLTQPSKMTAVVTSTNVSCFGGNNGTVKITSPNGGSGFYEYSIDGSHWFESGYFDHVQAGSYPVAIRDKKQKDCVVILNAALIVTQPAAMKGQVNYTNPDCFGAQTGTISISSVSGGSGSYSFSINGGTTWQTKPLFTGISAGSYTIMMKDNNVGSCFVTLNASLKLTSPDQISSSVASLTDVTCFNGDDGSVTIRAKGGSDPLAYTITPLAPSGKAVKNSTGVFTGLRAGKYSYSVTDINYCGPSTGTFTITQPQKAFSATLAVSNPACSQETGTATFTLSGGTAPYIVSVTSGNTVIGNTTIGNSIVFRDLPQGTYSYLASDSKNCNPVSGTFKVIIPLPLSISGSITNVTCQEGSNGAVTVKITGGTLPVVSYRWSGPAGFSSSDQSISGLKAGLYSLEITDSKGCRAFKQFQVGTDNGPVFISVTALNNGREHRTSEAYLISDPVIYSTGVAGNLGLPDKVTLTAKAYGGSGDFVYCWVPKYGLSSTIGAQVQSVPVITTSYTVTATDRKGCKASVSEQVTVKNIKCTTKNKKGVIMCMNGVSYCIPVTSALSVLNQASLGYCQTSDKGVGMYAMAQETALQEGEAYLSVYPNPADAIITARFKGFGSGDVRLRVYCVCGTLEKEKTACLDNEDSLVQMDVSDLAPGMYLIQAVQGSMTVQTRFIKQ